MVSILGYRPMLPNEIIQEGDVFYGSDPPGEHPQFHKSLSIGYTPAHSIHGYLYFRRTDDAVGDLNRRFECFREPIGSIKSTKWLI